MKYFILTTAVLILTAHSLDAHALRAVGSSSIKIESLSNAYVSAHFKCNRKRLWANLDTLRVVGNDTKQYVIAGGRKKITQYNTHVEFECTSKYKKEPTE